MNGRRETVLVRWGGPVVVWLRLLVLLAVTCASAFVPMGALNMAVNLAIASFMLLLVNASTLIQLTATSGFLWIIFMFTLTFADY
jgi:caa(3)-type oxidase subunit IV